MLLQMIDRFYLLSIVNLSNDYEPEAACYGENTKYGICIHFLYLI